MSSIVILTFLKASVEPFVQSRFFRLGEYKLANSTACAVCDHSCTFTQRHTRFNLAHYAHQINCQYVYARDSAEFELIFSWHRNCNAFTSVRFRRAILGRGHPSFFAFVKLRRYTITTSRFFGSEVTLPSTIQLKVGFYKRRPSMHFQPLVFGDLL